MDTPPDNRDPSNVGAPPPPRHTETRLMVPVTTGKTVESGFCARPGCKVHSSRCSRAFCVECCAKWHDHMDVRERADGIVGFRLRDRGKESHSHALAIVKPPVVERVPILGQVTRITEVDYQNAETYLNDSEKQALASPEMRDMLS